MSDRDLLVEQLVQVDEGLRLKPYTDTKGKITIGWGRNLTDVGITKAEAELLLNNDIDAAVADLATFPWFPHLDAVRQRALVDLRFNVGWAGFLKFKKLIAAIGTGDYVLASEELMKSKIAPNRKQTLVRMLATGIGVLLFAVSSFAQDFPSRAQDIVVTLYQQHKDLASGDDDQRRSLTKLMAEQIRYELGPEWGTKSAGVGRPQSKDAIARLTNGRLYGCDWQNGGSREPFGTIGCPEIPGQIFIPVDPTNHLTQAPPVVVLPPVIPPTDLQATILAELRAHEAAEKAFRDSVKGAWDTWRPRLEAITKYVVGPIVAYIAAKKW